VNVVGDESGSAQLGALAAKVRKLERAPALLPSVAWFDAAGGSSRMAAFLAIGAAAPNDDPEARCALMGETQRKLLAALYRQHQKQSKACRLGNAAACEQATLTLTRILDLEAARAAGCCGWSSMR
jgi:hypothetical protein